jgi:small subunit ribosomal protein S17
MAERKKKTEEPEGLSAEAQPVAEEPSAEAEESASEAEDAQPADPEPAAEPEASVEPEAAAEPGSQPAPGPEAASAAQARPKKVRKRVPRQERRQRPKPKRPAEAARKPIVRLPKPEAERGRTQERRGVVVSSAMDKTIVVRVEILKAHPRYKKIIRRSSKLHAHDERNQAGVGDVVRVVETRPLSRTKRWRLVEIIEAAK